MLELRLLLLLPEENELELRELLLRDTLPDEELRVLLLLLRDTLPDEELRELLLRTLLSVARLEEERVLLLRV
jgi:hypothetical protein